MITWVSSYGIFIVNFVVYDHSVNISLSDLLKINCNNDHCHHGSVGSSKLLSRGLASGINASLSDVNTALCISRHKERASDTEAVRLLSTIRHKVNESYLRPCHKNSNKDSKC
ncbi:hypothetical protein EV2_014639 [Malus domestica]